ncbi:hypothetical protein CEXT_22031 [Caerostris extrusa]|uniref:Ribosomal protein L22 n=1 Tax=Caerostris extrusa TaxID=172846 RepID=A0AAV4XW62_CAEEX|nr:hypothetical protein CEXT_22031 [Caerostris extrusa]
MKKKRFVILKEKIHFVLRSAFFKENKPFLGYLIKTLELLSDNIVSDAFAVEMITINQSEKELSSKNVRRGGFPRCYPRGRSFQISMILVTDVMKIVDSL